VLAAADQPNPRSHRLHAQFLVGALVAFGVLVAVDVLALSGELALWGGLVLWGEFVLVDVRRWSRGMQRQAWVLVRFWVLVREVLPRHARRPVVGEQFDPRVAVLAAFRRGDPYVPRWLP
jgi:hypothetical protein